MQRKQWQFQGGMQIARIPSVPGLYAWYYRPLARDTRAISKTIASFLEVPGEIKTEIQMRYGIRLVSKSPVNVVYGAERESPIDVLNEVIDYAEQFLVDFLNSDAAYSFTRPIYIGIAKDLYTRVYTQHYLSLDAMWDDNSSVSKYLNLFPHATVQSTMDKLNLYHSFALEARVRKIAPRDLMVHIFPTNSFPSDIGSDYDDPKLETASRRALEKLLQLVSDPICGRR
ncbi:MAG: hypothetical protein RIM23_05895 [Coleofasciculus sp. G3-WIS-01]|uniref:hypothetical protein n=1 Tax=Coleofasciculus sp. G3-WIS-01 TaxID=3069528 RepID=UPI0032FEE34C